MLANLTWSGVVRSDPGLLRLRLALRATATVGLVAVVMQVVGPAVGLPAIVATLLGGMVGMNGSFAVSGRAPVDAALTLTAYPVAAALGVVPAALLAGHRTVQLLGFVVAMVIAVFVRRFGPRAFVYGMVGWFAYFFTVFLKADVGMLLPLLAVVATATAVVVLVGAVLVPDRPAATYRAARTAFRQRVRALAATAADVVTEEIAGHRAVGRLHAAGLRLVEAALIIDAQLSGSGREEALVVRRTLMDAELAAEELAGAVTRLTGTPPEVLQPLARALEALGRGDHAEARRLLPQVGECAPDVPCDLGATHDATAAASRLADVLDGATRAEAPEHVREFEPAVDLFSGNLPGSAPAAVNALDGSTTGLSLNTRLCLQTALAAPVALGLGLLLSPTRYYWAVLACFLVLTGTFTTGEATTKGVNRVVGTLAGLLAATVAVHLTGHDTVAVVAVMLACVFVGLYFFRVSYAFMAFAVTTLMGELYNVLHEFSDSLLMLRVVETAVGAAVAVVVVLAVLPVRTARAVAAAEQAFLDALDTLLRDVADRLSRPGRTSSLLYDARRLDAQLHQVALVSRPAAGPVLAGLSSRSAVRAVGGYTHVAYRARALAALVTQVEPGSAPLSAALAQDLRERLRGKGFAPDVAQRRALEAAAGEPKPAVARSLAELRRAVDELAPTPLEAQDDEQQEPAEPAPTSLTEEEGISAAGRRTS